MIEEKYIGTKFGNVSYLQSGSGPKTLIYFHGWLGRPFMIRYLADYFPPKGFRVIAPYLPGHGSSFPLPSNFSYSDLIETMLDFFDQLTCPNRTLAGFSMGGSIAWGIAQKRVKKIRSLIVNDALLSPVNTGLIEVTLKALRDLSYSTIRAFVHNNLPKNMNNSPSIKWINSLNINRYKKVIETFSYPHSLIRHIPTLIMWGTKDSVLPLQEQVGNIEPGSNCRIKLFEGNHYWFLSKPATYLDEIGKFIKYSSKG